MGIQFAPQDGIPILLDAAATESTPRERRWPSGWWILPAIIGWIVALILAIRSRLGQARNFAHQADVFARFSLEYSEPFNER